MTPPAGAIPSAAASGERLAAFALKAPNRRASSPAASGAKRPRPESSAPNSDAAPSASKPALALPDCGQRDMAAPARARRAIKAKLVQEAARVGGVEGHRHRLETVLRAGRKTEGRLGSSDGPTRFRRVQLRALRSDPRPVRFESDVCRREQVCTLDQGMGPVARSKPLDQRREIAQTIRVQMAVRRHPRRPHRSRRLHRGAAQVGDRKALERDVRASLDDLERERAAFDRRFTDTRDAQRFRGERNRQVEAAQR